MTEAGTSRRRGSRTRLVPFGPAARHAAAYLCAGLVSTVLGAAVALAAVVAGALLSLTVVGTRAVPGLVVPVRAAAGLERRRVALMRGAAPASPYRVGAWRRGTARQVLRDPATWRDLGWLLLSFPVNLAGAVLAGSVCAVAVGLAALPIWYRFLPEGRATLYTAAGTAHGVVASVPAALPWAAAGVALLWPAGWLLRRLAGGQAALATALLRPGRTARLAERVAELAATRTAIVDAQQRQLRRIERDLHDGAQARLVALSADLGLAAERVTEDPAAARLLVERARDEVVQAVKDLRDLVRGIGPPILAARGLGAALEVVAGRSPVPVRLAVSLGQRLPDVVETTAYFVVSECLTNIARHSRATEATVRIGERDGSCVLAVRDDGVGGAAATGAGLSGLADRVAALGGTLTVDSPVGGPTIVRVDLPCAW